MEPVTYATTDYPLQITVGQDQLLKKMAEYAVSNTTFLAIVKNIANDPTQLESAFNDKSLFLTIGKEFIFDIKNITTFFENLDAQLNEIAEQDNEWLLTLTLQESQLDEQKGTILNFVTEIGFLLHQQVTNSFDSSLKAVIKYLFFGSVAKMNWECLNIAKLHMENFNIIIRLLNL